jgi:alkylation response protein AidB-like acyl-CoA dehydrogenase
LILTPSSDQEFFLETTTRFLHEHVSPSDVRALRHDAAGFDRGYWRRGAELGWTSLLVSEAHGGGTVSGAGLVDLGLIAYAFGRHAAPGPLMPTNVVAATLSARDAATSDVLPGLLSGDSISSWCAPDFVAGGGWSPSVRVRPAGDELVLTGVARAVESAAQADHLLVTAEGEGEGGTTQVLVPTDAPGVLVMPMRTADLTRRFFTVTFEDVRVPSAALVGVIGEAGEDVERQFRILQAMLVAESVGAMQAGFDMTVSWAFDRYSFGRPLASYQALKHRFADMYAWLEASHAISDTATTAVEAGSPEAGELISAAKAFVGEYGGELLHECVQLHGGMGVTFEHDLHLFVRRFTVDRASAGTPSDHRQRVAAVMRERLEAA